MSSEHLKPIGLILKVESVFGKGSFGVVETAITRNLRLLRQGESDAYTLSRLEIASRVLLGRSSINENEMAEILKENSFEWRSSLPVKNSPENNYFAVLAASEHYLLTGDHLASEKVLKKLKKGAEIEAEARFKRLFEESFDKRLYDGSLTFFTDKLIAIAELGLVSRYLDLDFFDDKISEIINVLMIHATNIAHDLNNRGMDHSIETLKLMADIMIIKAALTKVSEDGKTELFF